MKSMTQVMQRRQFRVDALEATMLAGGMLALQGDEDVNISISVACQHFVRDRVTGFCITRSRAISAMRCERCVLEAGILKRLSRMLP